LRVGKLISDNYNDITVIYTRKKDETVELFKRAEIANKNNADLFISIHCNSAENRSANGVETWVMGLEKTPESIAIAKKENADMLLEKDYTANYSGFDPNSPEAYIIFSLYSSAYLNWSTILASKVQKHLVNNTRMTDRAVHQGTLWVLYKVAMPSILIELGFICNTEEEKYLVNEDNQDVMATSIYNAFVEYKNLLEGSNKPFLPLPGKKPASQITPHETAETIKPSPIDSAATINIPNSKDISGNTETPAIATEKPPPTEPAVISTPNDIRFRIQFFTSKDSFATSDKKFTSLKDVKKYNEKGVWKYTSGDFKTLEEAQTILKEVRKQYGDAFVIAFNKEHKITIQEAQELLK
jgi:N-acetylmuramoyl-L-alanine amidase